MQWPELEFWRQTKIKHCAATKYSLDSFEATRDRLSVFHLLSFTGSCLQGDLLLPWQEELKSLTTFFSYKWQQFGSQLFASISSFGTYVFLDVSSPSLSVIHSVIIPHTFRLIISFLPFIHCAWHTRVFHFVLALQIS